MVWGCCLIVCVVAKTRIADKTEIQSSHLFFVKSAISGIDSCTDLAIVFVFKNIFSHNGIVCIIIADNSVMAFSVHSG